MNFELYQGRPANIVKVAIICVVVLLAGLLYSTTIPYLLLYHLRNSMLFVVAGAVYVGLLWLLVEVLTKALKAPAPKYMKVVYLILGIVAGYIYFGGCIIALWDYGNFYWEQLWILFTNDVIGFFTDTIRFIFVNLITEMSVFLEYIKWVFGQSADYIAIVIFWVLTFVACPLVLFFCCSQAFKPFDYDSSSWMVVRKALRKYFPSAADGSSFNKNNVIAGDLSYLTDISHLQEAPMYPYIEVFYYQAADGSLTDIISADSLTTVKGRYGPTESRSHLLPPLHIGSSGVNALLAVTESPGDASMVNQTTYQTY